MGIFTNIVFPLFICFCTVTCYDEKKLISIDNIYKAGVKAYTDDRWSVCISNFEEVIHLYKLYKSVVTNCKHTCHQLSYEPAVNIKIEDLQVIEMFGRRNKCIMTCKENGLKEVNIDNNLSREVFESLSTLEPYNYIHLCYFRMNLMPKAASATFTYLSLHPDDTTMKHNYNYYIRQPEVDENEVLNLESSDYKLLYSQGAVAYEKEQWADMVSTMEEVIKDYLAAENRCRFTCDDQKWDQRFENIADYFLLLLQCKQKCQQDAVMGFKSGVDFLADVLNHLQFGYYKLEKLGKAASAVQSYLLIYPNDEIMKENKNIYNNMVNVQVNDFVEIPDIVHYYMRDKYEKELLDQLSNVIHD